MRMNGDEIKYLSTIQVRMLALPSRGLLRVLQLLLALFFLINLGIDAYYTRKYGGIDLRDKVMGGRMLFSGTSIYTFKWHAGDDVRLFDPNDAPSAELNRYTGSPAQSLLFSSLNRMDFGTIRITWLLAQYGLFALCVWLFARGADKMDRTLLWASAVVLMLCSIHWHLHVERGQIYVLFGAAMAVIAYLSLTGSIWSQRFTGAILTVLVVMKPTYAVLGLPYLFARRWNVVAGGLVSLVGLVALFGALGLFDDWQNYFAAMQRWSVANFDTGADRTAELMRGGPSIVEGLTNLRERKAFDVEDDSLRGLASFIHGQDLSPRVCQMFTLVGFVVLFPLFIRRFRSMTGPDLFLLAFLGWWWTIFCLPAPRYDYQYVQWLAPLLLIIRDRRHYAPEGLALLIAGALFGLRLFSFAVPFSYLLGEVLMLLGVLVILWVRYRPFRDQQVVT